MVVDDLQKNFMTHATTDCTEYILHVYEDRQIRQRRSDGYFSATDMCKSVDRLFADFYRIKNTKEYLKILSTTLSLPENQITKGTKKGGTRQEQGTWVHPQVATIIGTWMSPRFTIKVAEWIEEWKKVDKQNDAIYCENLCRLQVSENEQKERNIQEELCVLLKGKKEVQTIAGFIDILTEKAIIEIKEFSEWKGALGQILSYADFYPEKQKIVVLFGDVNIELLTTIKRIYGQFNIQLQIFSDEGLSDPQM